MKIKTKGSIAENIKIDENREVAININYYGMTFDDVYRVEKEVKAFLHSVEEILGTIND